MSESSNENTHKRDRHRRGRGRDGKGAQREAARAEDRRGEGRQAEPRREDARRAEGRREDARREGAKRDERLARDRGRQDRGERKEQLELPPLPTLPTPICPKCGQPIQDITSALPDKSSGEPLHFDCVISFLEGAETLGPNEKIVYIGQGRFAVTQFDNPSDTRKFKILRVIEWEGREARPEWRSDIAGLFSQVR